MRVCTWRRCCRCKTKCRSYWARCQYRMTQCRQLPHLDVSATVRTPMICPHSHQAALLAIQYNTIFFILLQSQTDRCESDIQKYNRITNRQLSRRTVLWEVLRLVTTGSILEMEKYNIYTIYTFAPIRILSVGCRLVAQYNKTYDYKIIKKV